MLTLDLSQAGAQQLDGPAGTLEIWLDLPATPPRGYAIVCHPQPLLGGHAGHKVPQFLARALADAGWCVVRPNFRGVGQSAGSYDHGVGETDDMLALHGALAAALPGLPSALVGISFGGYVLAHTASRLDAAGIPPQHLCVVGMPAGAVPDTDRYYDTPARLPSDALVIHGEQDERVPLADLLAWARPSGQPVMVIPGADHLLSGKLSLLRRLVLRHLAA